MKTKNCYNCKKEKDILLFGKNKTNKDGFQSICKECQKEYRLHHKKEAAEYHKQYIKAHRKEIQEYYKNYWLNYYNKNKESRKKICREYNAIHKKERNEYRNRWRCKKRKEDVLFKFIENIRNVIRNSFKRYHFSKNSKTYQILGCSFDFFQNYLFEKARIRYPSFETKNFLENGKYHIDHIVPLSTAKSEEDVVRLCYYTNFQLLTKEDNLTKHDSLNWRQYEN